MDDIEKAEDGRPFIAMEYISGNSLKDAIQHEAPLSVQRACRIRKQLASALDLAHQMGMVHRDVKPGNIVLIIPSPSSGSAAAVEQAKVLDFGIAKAKEGHIEDTRLGHLTLTGTGMVVGTPAHMSPEQAKGVRGPTSTGDPIFIPLV